MSSIILPGDEQTHQPPHEPGDGNDGRQLGSGLEGSTHGGPTQGGSTPFAQQDASNAQRNRNEKPKADEDVDTAMSGNNDVDDFADEPDITTNSEPASTHDATDTHSQAPSTFSTEAMSQSLSTTSALSMFASLTGLSQLSNDIENAETPAEQAALLNLVKDQILRCNGTLRTPSPNELRRRRLVKSLSSAPPRPPLPAPYYSTQTPIDADAQPDEQMDAESYQDLSDGQLATPANASRRARRKPSQPSRRANTHDDDGSQQQMIPKFRNLSLSPDSKRRANLKTKAKGGAASKRDTTSLMAKTGASLRDVMTSRPRLATRMARRRRALAKIVEDDHEPPKNAPCPVDKCKSTMVRTDTDQRRCDCCTYHTHLDFLYTCTHHGSTCTLCAQRAADIRSISGGRVPGTKAAWTTFKKQTELVVGRLRRSEEPRKKGTEAPADIASDASSDDDDECEDSDIETPGKSRISLRRESTGRSRTSLKDYDSADLDALQDEENEALQQQENAYAQFQPPPSSTPPSPKKRDFFNFDECDFNLSSDNHNEDPEAKCPFDPTPPLKKRKSNATTAIPTARVERKRKKKKSKDKGKADHEANSADELRRIHAAKKASKKLQAKALAAEQRRGYKLVQGIKDRWTASGQPKWNAAKLTEATKEKKRLLEIQHCFAQCYPKKKRQTAQNWSAWMLRKGVAPKLYRKALDRVTARERVLKAKAKAKAKATKSKTKAKAKAKTAPTSTTFAGSSTGAPTHHIDVRFGSYLLSFSS